MNVIVGDETGLLKLTDMGRRSYRFVWANLGFICVSFIAVDTMKAYHQYRG